MSSYFFALDFSLPAFYLWKQIYPPGASLDLATDIHVGGRLMYTSLYTGQEKHLPEVERPLVTSHKEIRNRSLRNGNSFISMGILP